LSPPLACPIASAAVSPIAFAAVEGADVPVVDDFTATVVPDVSSELLFAAAASVDDDGADVSRT